MKPEVIDLPGEIWKQVESFPLYWVSNLGRVATNRWLNGKDHGWRILKKANGTYPAVILSTEEGAKSRQMFLVHRLVWITFNGEIPKGFQVDHKDRDKRNPALSNLRLATPRDNLCNSKSRPNRTGYKGVYTNYRKFQAMIRDKHGNRTHLGSFKTPEEAALAYNMAAIKYHGEFAILNEIHCPYRGLIWSRDGK